MDSRFVILPSLIIASLVGGYFARKFSLAPPWVAKVFMTLVTVLGYPTIGLLSIWKIELQLGDIWLPALSAVQMLWLAMLAVPIARHLTSDREEVGLLSLHSAINNSGLTMGGFVIYLLYGTYGLALANIYCITFAPMVVLLGYPIARHYAPDHPPLDMGRLLLRSIFDWRSIGLPMSIAGILLSPSVLNVPRPPQIDSWHIIDVLMYWINFSAYFAIGMQLRLSFVAGIWRLIGGLGVMRFAFGLGTAVVLVWLTYLTPVPLEGLGQSVFLIQSFTPCGVTCVAIATMFGLRPAQSSALFMANTLMYLLLVLPLVMWYFS